MNGKKIAIIFVIAFFALCSIGIAVTRMSSPSEDYAMASGDTDVPMTQWITLSIDGYSITLDMYAQNVWYDAVQLTTERETQVTVGDFSGCTVAINGQTVEPNETISIKLERLYSLDSIEIYAKNTATQAETRNYIRTLPESFYQVSVLSNNPDEGYYYMNLKNYICKVSTDGNIVYYKYVGDLMYGATNTGLDFKRTVVDGKVYYSYLVVHDPVDSPNLRDGCGWRCYAIVMDENYNEIDRVYVLTDEDGKSTTLESHQFTILGEKHYLLSAYVGKRVTNIPDDVPHSELGARVTASVIQEIDNGQVIWEWDSTDHPELYAMSTEGNDYFNEEYQWSDYVHFNAITIDPKDNNFLCSFRNLDAVLKLDRQTGEILWVLGGSGDQFGLTEEQLFSKQHDIRPTSDGGYTLFNNGNIDNQSGQTSIMKFYLDEVNKKVIKFEEYQVEKSFSAWMGSAQELSAGHYLIGWGHSLSRNAVFSEIDFTSNTVLFELCYPEDGVNYRVYKDIA